MSNVPNAVPAAGGDTHSGQWGLSALLIGGLVVILFPIMVMSFFGAVTAAYGNDFLQSSDLDLGVLTTEVSTGGLLGLAIFALVCGIIGIMSALFRRQPCGLAAGGTVVEIVAVLLAIVLVVIASKCIDWTREFQKQRFSPEWRRGNPIQIPR
ncbi:MAG TPA: hypothetical protein VGZ47_20910 [Gemmataceae bacterium]|jgi:hypothetical protein|nr:hypothetical protein [Gemmataceae bacterium]